MAPPTVGLAEKLFWILAYSGCSSTMLVIKSQIHAGGRGKGTFKSGYQGWVKLCKTAEEAQEIASNMLGQVLVT